MVWWVDGWVAWQYWLQASRQMDDFAIWVIGRMPDDRLTCCSHQHINHANNVVSARPIFLNLSINFWNLLICNHAMICLSPQGPDLDVPLAHSGEHVNAALATQEGSNQLVDISSTTSEKQGLIGVQRNVQNYHSLDPADMAATDDGPSNAEATDVTDSGAKNAARRSSCLDVVRNASKLLFQYVMQHSYVGSLIIMMVSGKNSCFKYIWKRPVLPNLRYICFWYLQSWTRN